MPVIESGLVIEGSVYRPRIASGAPSAGVDEIQTITLGGTPTGGTFKLAFDGHTTAAITWTAVDATLVAAIDAALEALPNIGTGGVTTAAGSVSSGIGTITVTFIGNNAKKNVALMTAISSLTGTVPTVVVATTTAGVDATARGAGFGARYINSASGVEYINTGTALEPVWSQQTTPSAEMVALEAAIPVAAVPDLGALTATGIAAAVGALTATAIAAAVPAAAPAGGTGATAGAYDSAVNRDAAIVTINDLRTHAIEMDLDYEAMLVDVGMLRTHAIEVDLDYEAMLVDVAAIRTKLNALLSALRTAGIVTP